MAEIFFSGSDMAGLLRAVQKKGAAFRFKATGISMKPSILDGDVLLVSPLPGISPYRGEVVAFCHPQTNRLILHRVVRVKGESYFIRGDNLRRVDHVERENILGVVTKIERRGKMIFWPDRFRRPVLSRLYLKGYLVYLYLRRRVRSKLLL